MAVVPSPPSYFGDSLFSHLQLGAPFPGLSTNSLPLNDTCPAALGGGGVGGGGGGSGVPSSGTMAAHQSLSFNKSSSSAENAAFGSWNFAPFLLDYYTLGTNLQTVVDSMYPPVNDYLSLVSDTDFLSYGSPLPSTTSSSGCGTPVMHPNLVSTLKSMVSPSEAGSSSAFGSSGLQLMFDPQSDQSIAASVSTHITQLFDCTHAQPSLSMSDAVHSITASENSCITQQQQHARALEPTIKQEIEKSDSSADDNMEAAVVPVDLIHNRRPFRCSHDGCNKTFKNPQTMKMHHKTHCADGSAASRAGLVASASHSLTSSLKAGHNKKIPSRCPKCKKTFVGLYELRRHYGRKHSEGEKGFGCRKCGKRFYIEVDVRDHEKLCGEPIECKCGLKFAFKCNLVAHKKAHPACQDNHHAAANSSDDSSNQSRGNSPGIALSFKPAGSSRSTGSQGSSKSEQQNPQQQEVTSPHAQSLLQSPLDFAENFKQSTTESNLSGMMMHFPVTSLSAETSLWPPMQTFGTECHSAQPARQSFFNFGYTNSNPFFSTTVSDSGFPLQQQQQNNMFSSKLGSTLLEDLVNSSSHGAMQVTASLPNSMGINISTTAAAYSSCSSFSNLQVLKNGSLQTYM